MSEFDVRTEEENENPLIPTVVFSIIFHIVVLVIIPLVLTLFRKPAEFERPETFELVSLPQPVVKKVEQKPEPKKEVVKKEEPKKEIEKVQPKPEPKKVVSRKQPKKEPEKKVEKKPEPKPDLSDIDDLFAESKPAPKVSTIKSVNSFKYNWYLANLRGKIEQNWKPAVRDSTIAVELKFDIQKNGTLSGLSIKKSSGKAVLDAQAKRAVELAFPMAPLPSGYSGGSLSLIYTLVPYRN